MGWAAAIGAAASIGSSISAYASAKKLQEDAQQFQTSFYKQRYQRQMEDMREAGLNPLLAYKTGVGPGTSAGIASTSGVGRLAEGMKEGAGAKERTTASELNKAQILTEKQKADTLYAQGILAGSSARDARAAAELKEAKIPDATTRRNFDMTAKGQKLSTFSRGAEQTQLGSGMMKGITSAVGGAAAASGK